MIVLLQHGADPNARDCCRDAALHSAIQRRADFAVVEELLKRGADGDAKDCYGSTPLHWASERGNSHVVVELLSAGADPNAIDGDGNTPMHLACSYDGDPLEEERVTVLKALLEKGADIHAANDERELSIDFALRLMESSPVKCLLQHHYSSLCDGEGRLPLHAILRDATLDGNTTPPLRTALHQNVLVTNDLLEIIVFLVNQNPELVTALDEDGSVSLHVVCTTSAPLEIVRYLVEYAPGALRVARTTDGSYP
jgi:hypothetical protein